MMLAGTCCSCHSALSASNTCIVRTCVICSLNTSGLLAWAELVVSLRHPPLSPGPFHHHQRHHHHQGHLICKLQHLSQTMWWRLHLLKLLQQFLIAAPAVMALKAIQVAGCAAHLTALSIWPKRPQRLNSVSTNAPSHFSGTFCRRL